MFERIKLPYDYSDLEPFIDQETVKTHYEKHHRAYTDNFNKLIKDVPECEGKSALEILTSLDSLPEAKRAGVGNNGGGFYNHNFYFESLVPGGKKPSTAFTKAVEKEFDDFGTMLEKLCAAATTTLFGSGWAWLVSRRGKLDVVVSSNQDLPEQKSPPILLLPVDMWEHAYYLMYKNEKKEYVTNLFKVIDWEKVEERLEAGNAEPYWAKEGHFRMFCECP